jgi:hypothetical protein
LFVGVEGEEGRRKKEVRQRIRSTDVTDVTDVRKKEVRQRIRSTDVRKKEEGRRKEELTN